MNWRRLWGPVHEDRAGGSAHDALGDVAAEESLQQTGPTTRREDDQVASKPSGDPGNLIGWVSLAYDRVSHHPGLVNALSNTAECSPGVLPPLIGEADQDTTSNLGECVCGRRRKHVHEHQLRPIAGGQACRPIHPLVRQRGEIGRTQDATMSGPAHEIPPSVQSGR